MVDFRYVPNIGPEDWNRVSDEERATALQDLENRNALEQRRDPCTVVGVSSDKDEPTEGDYIRKTKSIFVNSALIRCSDPREAVKTVIHEGQHDYQYDCVERPEEHPEISFELKCRFADNQLCYVKPGKSESQNIRYKNQIVEVDARDAEERVIRKYEQIFEKDQAVGTPTQKPPNLSDASEEIRSRERLSQSHQQMVERARLLTVSVQTSILTVEPEQSATLDHGLDM